MKRKAYIQPTSKVIAYRSVPLLLGGPSGDSISGNSQVTPGVKQGYASRSFDIVDEDFEAEGFDE